MSLRATGALCLALLLGGLALASETRTIELPRVGLSLEVPADWTVEQYGDALLEFRSGELVVWVRPCDAPDAKKPMRTWTEPPEGGARCVARVARDGVSVFEVEASLPDAGQLGVVDALLDSMDTTPYLHATRHVDWRDGWTLTLPEGWERKAESGAGVARFDAQDGASRLWVENLAGLMKAAGGVEDAPRDLDAWAEFAWKEGLERLQKREGLTSEKGPTIEKLKIGDAEGRRMHLGLDLDADDEGRPRAWMHVLVLGGYRVLAYARGPGGEVDFPTREALESFRLGTHPGPRVSTAAPTDRFPGDKGPAVVFRLPEGWSVTPGTNEMRLAQVVMSGVEGVEAVVYFFGAGRGGEVEDNLERWRGQMQGDDEGTVETQEPVEGVKITLLDVTGAYATSRMNPHGRDPHGGNPHGGGDADHGGFRMLGGIVEIPGGPLFLKLVGPDEVVAAQKKAVTTWLLSFRPAK